MSELARDKLKSFVERIEACEVQKAEMASDIKDLYTQAELDGFDKKVMRKLIALRKQDASERRDEDAILTTYMRALGMEG